MEEPSLKVLGMSDCNFGSYSSTSGVKTPKELRNREQKKVS